MGAVGRRPGTSPPAGLSRRESVAAHHLLLLHPSRDLWKRVAAAIAVDLPDHPATSALPLRDDDPTAALPADSRD